MTEEREISRGEKIDIENHQQKITLTPSYQEGEDGFVVQLDAQSSSQFLAASAFTLFETLYENCNKEEKAELKSMLQEMVVKFD